MGQITLGVLTTRVQAWMPGHLESQVSIAANEILNDLYSFVTFLGRSTFTLRAPYSTGTVAVTGGGATTSVTGTGTSWSASWAPCLIRISGEDTWFVFTPTAGTTGTLSSAWPGETGSGLTYEIVHPFVAFPNTVQHPTRMRIEGNADLRHAVESDEMWGGSIEPGRPTHFSVYDPDESSDALFRVQLHPPPDADYALTYGFVLRPTYFTSGDSSSKPNLPDLFDQALVAGTLALCWDQEDKQDRARFWFGRYKELKAQVTARWNALAVAQPRAEDEAGGLWVLNREPWA